jgi:UDPglucose 6-dehydrogenase/GDP-mannose 6-dehydrogenase
MRVCIVGTGYVGLVSGACFAELGHQVICVDVDKRRIEALQRRKSPIFETGLDELLERHVGHGLSASTDLQSAVRASEITFIAVGTPFDGQSINVEYVRQAASEIGAALAGRSDYHVVVVKSTVVPGTTDGVVRVALETASGKTCGADFGLSMNPEFLSEGSAVHDFLFPDRLVLGGSDERSTDTLEKLYVSFPATVPRLRTNTRTAEMIKYASNALLANLISFSNEIANLGTAIGGIDATEVMRGVHLSQYFREQTEDGLPAITAFLKAGCGFGGSCLPKDVKALIAHGHKAGVSMQLLESVIRVNELQPAQTIGLLRRYMPNLEGLRVAVLGLSFKPGTDDIRESPAFPIMRELLAQRAQLKAFDPIANEEARRVFDDPRVTYCGDLKSAIADIDAVIVVTPWKDFQVVPELLRDRQPPVIFVDGRRAFDRSCLPRYVGIGL